MKKVILTLILGLACMTSAKAGDWSISIGIPGIFHVGNHHHHVVSYCPPPVVTYCPPPVVHYSAPVISHGVYAGHPAYIPSPSVVYSIPHRRTYSRTIVTHSSTHTKPVVKEKKKEGKRKKNKD